MKSWTCPDCSTLNNDPQCSNCGYINFGTLILEGSGAGKFKTKIDFKIDRSVYKKISPAEYKYAEDYPSYQFNAFKSTELISWAIQPSSYSVQNVLLNGKICNYPDVYPIKEGDIISLGSKRNLDVTIADIKVKIEL
jgi:hypothetical protein